MAFKPKKQEHTPESNPVGEEDFTSSMDLKAAGLDQGKRGSKVNEIMARIRVQSAIFRARSGLMYQALKAKKLHYAIPFVIALPIGLVGYQFFGANKTEFNPQPVARRQMRQPPPQQVPPEVQAQQPEAVAQVQAQANNPPPQEVPPQAAVEPPPQAVVVPPPAQPAAPPPKAAIRNQDWPTEPPRKTAGTAAKNAKGKATAAKGAAKTTATKKAATATSKTAKTAKGAAKTAAKTTKGKAAVKTTATKKTTAAKRSVASKPASKTSKKTTKKK